MAKPVKYSCNSIFKSVESAKPAFAGQAGLRDKKNVISFDVPNREGLCNFCRRPNKSVYFLTQRKKK